MTLKLASCFHRPPSVIKFHCFLSSPRVFVSHHAKERRLVSVSSNRVVDVFIFSSPAPPLLIPRHLGVSAVVVFSSLDRGDGIHRRLFRELKTPVCGARRRRGRGLLEDAPLRTGVGVGERWCLHCRVATLVEACVAGSRGAR